MIQIFEIVYCIVALNGNITVNQLANTILICEGIRIILEIIKHFLEN